MTDKQIIIDGCNVSGCEYFRKDDPCKNTCHYFCTPCEWVQIQNCMYKYGKRKEQECEILKLSEKSLTETIENIAKGFEELKAENDKLKQTLTEIKVLSENVYCLTNALNRDMALFAKQILQKISEVENE